MTPTDWRDTVLLTLGFVFSIVSGLVGAYIQRRLDQHVESRPLNRLLNFGRDDLLFVFPKRPGAAGALLPLILTEDFLAVNNFITCLLKISWNRKMGVRDVGPAADDMKHVSAADRKRNLVIICSTKSNALAAEFQEELHRSYQNSCTFEMENGKPFIKGGDGEIFKGPSYKQVADYLGSGVTPGDLSAKKYDDYALVIKATNPWNKHNKVVWIAGIRGIGTWGAAECLKKEWRQLYKKLPRRSKAADFAAIIKISYNNCDITSIKVCRADPLLRRGQ